MSEIIIVGELSFEGIPENLKEQAKQYQNAGLGWMKYGNESFIGIVFYNDVEEQEGLVFTPFYSGDKVMAIRLVGPNGFFLGTNLAFLNDGVFVRKGSGDVADGSGTD